MSAEFRRTLPEQPDLEQLKKQAKELLRAFRAGDAEAGALVRGQLPDKRTIVLADAQFVIAREYGFVSWTKLKQHIEAKSERPAAEQMKAALEKRDARTVRRILETHEELRAHINDPVFSFDSPAVVAFADDDDPALLEVLLEFGADPNRKSSWWAGGFHPLYGASPAAAKVLIAAGAVIDACAAAHLDRPDLLEEIIARDPSRVHERGGDGQTPLHFARSRAVVDLLLAAGADLNARDVDHRSTAAEWMLDRRRGAGRYDLAAYLVERGADSDIFLAAALGLNERVRELLKNDSALLDLRTTQGDYGEKPPSSYHIYMWTIAPDRLPIQVAAQFDHPDTVEVMRSFATPRQQLLAALAEGDAAGAQALLRMHPDALAQLSAEDRSILPDAAWSARASAVRLMLDLGFDPLTRNQGGATALHNAAWEGSLETVRVLLRHPAAAQLLPVRDSTYDATPLDWCCHGSCHGNPQHAHAAVARLLLEAGAVPRDEIHDVSDSVRKVIDDWRATHANR